MNGCLQFLACHVQLLRQQQDAAVRGQQAGVSESARALRHRTSRVVAGGDGAVLSAANARQVG